MWKKAILFSTVNAVLLGGILYYENELSSKRHIDVEVVVAHYDENLDWIDYALRKAPHVRYSVYSKNKEPPEGTTSIPNVGRESHTFLYHIVKHYDSLADWTVFTQAAAPSFGFRAFNHESGHMCSGVTWDNYIEPFPNGEDWYMVQTVATRYPEIWHSDRLDMMFETPYSLGQTCPRNKKGWSKWWREADHPLIQKQLLLDEGSLPPVEFYNKYVVASHEVQFLSFTVNYANGGRFAASRERIRRRPLGYYKDLLRELSRNINPIEGYYMESMWYDVFHPERLQAEHGPECKVPRFPLGGPASHSEMFDDATARYHTEMIREYGKEWPRGLSSNIYS